VAGAHEAQCRERAGGEGGLKRLVGHVEQPSERDLLSIVYQDVDAAELFGRGRDATLDLFRVSDVADARERMSAPALDLLHHVEQLGLGASSHRYRAARGRQSQCDATSHALTRARNDRALSLERTHAPPPIAIRPRSAYPLW
jgi:hypothetical protein